MRFYIDNPSAHRHTGGVVDPTTGRTLVAPGTACFIFRWDDGTPVTFEKGTKRGDMTMYPKAQKYCFDELKRDEIMQKLARLEAAAKQAAAQAASGATREEVQASASKADKATGNVSQHVLTCKDGVIVIQKNMDTIFLPSARGAKPHGILMMGADDKDRDFVRMLIGAIVAAGQSGASERMTGRELLEMDPYGKKWDRSERTRAREIR